MVQHEAVNPLADLAFSIKVRIPEAFKRSSPPGSPTDSEALRRLVLS